MVKVIPQARLPVAGQKWNTTYFDRLNRLDPPEADQPFIKSFHAALKDI